MSLKGYMYSIQQYDGQYRKLHFNMICSLRMSIKLWMLQCLDDNNIVHNVSMLQLRGSGGNATTKTSWLHNS